jgi:hypothetical protein
MCRASLVNGFVNAVRRTRRYEPSRPDGLGDGKAGQAGFPGTREYVLIHHFWLYHCHVNDHIAGGMAALYRVS